MSLDQSVLRTQQVGLGVVASSFYPRGTVRCVGQPVFRTQAARDLACLLDVDPNVSSWSCLSLPLKSGKCTHIPDLTATTDDGIFLIDAAVPPDWVPHAADLAGFRYELDRYCGQEQRQANAKDLLRYCNFIVPLGDRVRLLAILDEHGPLPLSDCMQIARPGSDGVAVVAAMALHRLIDIDLDSGPIGPETRISKI